MTINKFKQGTLTYVHDDKEDTVLVADYVKAKTKDLVEFGYSSLKEKQVLEVVYDIIVKGETKKTVIHGFIEGEVKA